MRVFRRAMCAALPLMRLHSPLPAASAVQVAALFRPDVLIEIEAMAIVRA